MCSPTDILLALIAILFPPLPVWINRGLCSADSLINLLLCLLGYLPGLLHAWYIIASTPDEYYAVEDVERGGAAPGATVTYYYIQEGPARGYGTVAQAQGTAPQQQQGGQSGSGGDVPPAYEEAVRDHKVQGP